MNKRDRIVVIGGGFAGFHAVRTLTKRLKNELKNEEVEITLLNPTDYFLYLPLLPEVAAGLLDPRRIAISLPAAFPNVKFVLGEAKDIDLSSRSVRYTNPEDKEKSLEYDRLILTVGSVNKLLPIPGVAEHAHGFRGIPEALYFRDHITSQIELAASAEDPAERDARCTFVIVGAGYTGTELAAQGPIFSSALARRHPELKHQKIRWLLLDKASRVLPELDERLSRTADQVLRERGVEIHLGLSIEEATEQGVRLTGGDSVSTRSLIWCVGVRPDPLVESLDLPTEKGRLVVTNQLRLATYPEIFACGDAAAVPDLTRPGEFTAMTAQHATRQGILVAHNVIASLTGGRQDRYKHHDLGFVVDLGKGNAAANPLQIPLSGFLAKIVTRAYHLMAMPGNRVRTALDWLLDTVLSRQSVQLGLIQAGSVPLETTSPELAKGKDHHA